MITFLMVLAQTAAGVPADTIPPATREAAVTAAMPANHPGIGDVPRWTPHRVYDTERKRWTGFEEMAAEAARADVVFFGEQHDDPGTHAMQRALLEAIGRRRGDVVLSLEMFERDAQPMLDRYLAGEVTEDSLMATGRPWPRYRTDYRPAVEWARAHGWPVIAANIPRPIASAVSKSGYAALDSVPGAERTWFARDMICRTDGDDYFDKFAETMREHVPGDSEADKAAALNRYYLSQCAKDETMAESILEAREASGDQALVVHLNGAFHSNYGLGTAERVRRRVPSARIVVISAIPVESLDAANPSKDDRSLGDWLIYTITP
jgi:uncharacterized iron-regulated protein